MRGRKGTRMFGWAKKTPKSDPRETSQAERAYRLAFNTLLEKTKPYYTTDSRGYLTRQKFGIIHDPLDDVRVNFTSPQTAKLELFSSQRAFCNEADADTLLMVCELYAPLLDQMPHWPGFVVPETPASFLAQARPLVDAIREEETKRTEATADSVKAALKELGYPTNAPGNKFPYEVALSFAGERRGYVEEVVKNLGGVEVFYDDTEKADLWGKDLYQHLAEVYSKKARYCVVFISAEYAKKRWTRAELKAAQARAFSEHREYILPARFDDTEIDGIHETVGYIDLRKTKPVELASLIRKKLSAA